MKENPDRKIKKGAKRLKTQDPMKLENITKVQKPHDSPVPPPPHKTKTPPALANDPGNIVTKPPSGQPPHTRTRARPSPKYPATDCPRKPPPNPNSPQTP